MRGEPYFEKKFTFLATLMNIPNIITNMHEKKLDQSIDFHFLPKVEPSLTSDLDLGV